MKYGIKKRILSLLLCFSMIIPALTYAMPVYSVASTLTDANTNESTGLDANVNNQAIFDWWSSFDIAKDVNSQPGEVSTVSYDDIGASNLVVMLVGYYYDMDDGSHWYKVAAREGETLPSILSENPWVLYTSDLDIEDGFGAYLCIYEADETIRFVTSETEVEIRDEETNEVLSTYIMQNFYVLAGPSELGDANINITYRDSDYPVSDLAYTELTYGTTFSKAFDITITKSNEEPWAPSDGLVSVRYEATQVGVETYTEYVDCGAGFVYIDDQMYSAAPTDRLGYEISGLVYTNSGSSTLVFEHMLSSFAWVGLPGYFTNTTLRMYSNTFEIQECIADLLPEKVSVAYSFVYEGTEYYWIEHEEFVGSPYFIVKASDMILEQTLENPDGEVSVSGKIPMGVYLDAAKVSLDELVDVYPNPTPEYDYTIADTVPHVVYDLSLFDEEGIWQPSDNEKITVTIRADELQLTPGDDYLVYHLHIDENGTPIPEWLGAFNSKYGDATFEIDRFSYVLILNPGTTTINNNVIAFYPVSSYAEDPCELPPAGNGQWFIVGIYFEADNTSHILLGSNGKMPSLDKIDYVEVNGQTFYNPGSKGYKPSADKKESSFTPYHETVRKIDMKISDTTVTVIDLDQVTNAHSFGAVLDIELDNTIAIGSEFELSLKATTGGSSTDNSFNIGGLDVSLYLEYNIQKEVAVGTSANGEFAESVTVERGDWVIYKIAINNTGTLPLSEMHLHDFLPAGVFDRDSVQMSVDGINGEVGTWQPFDEIIFEDYSCDGVFEHNVYIKAQVLAGLNIDQDTKYTNTAEFDGMGMPVIQDTADIIVKAPVQGTLTVSKAVTTANPNDPAPADAAFTFKFEVTGTTRPTFGYTINGVSYTVANGGTFQLKNGESAVFEQFPVGATYTITETADSQYATKINGVDGYSYTETMTEGDSPVVAFENQFKVREGAITVNKVVEKEYEYDVLPDDEFEFRIAFDESIRDNSYEYEIDGVVVGNIANGGTIKIKAGQSFVIVGYPNNTPYTITEITNSKYVTTVGGDETNVVSGVSSTSGSSHTFVNTYKKVLTSLTVNKEVHNIEDESIPANQSFKFEITHPDGSVTYKEITITEEIPGGTEANPGKGYGSVTLHGLPTGTYTVKEVEIRPGYDCDWPNDTTTVVLNTAGGEVTCINKYPIYVVYFEARQGGSVSVDEAGLDINTGKFDPSTASPNAGYEFVGWYDENGNLISTDQEFAPGLEYDSQTLTAVFRASLTSLKITKQGHDAIDENQTFLFRLTDEEGLELTVTVHGNSSVTVDGLTVGKKYKIVEISEWSWRYTHHGVVENATTVVITETTVANGAKFTLNPTGNVITFTNERSNPYWLDGDSWCNNIFKNGE